MRGRTAARVGGAIVVSLCVHLSIGRWTPAPPATVAKSAAPVEVSIVELGSAEKKRPPEPLAAPQAAAPQVEKVAPPVKRRARAPSRVEQRVAEALPAEAEVVVPSPAPEAVAAAAPMPDLSPSAVARSCQTAGLLSMPEQPAARPAPKATDAQAELTHHLFEVANDVPYARRRDAPKLVTRDGNLWYEGTGFFAVVTADGTVKFSDIVFADTPRKPPEFPPGLAPEYIEVVKRIQQLLSIPIPWPDLTDMVARISDDDPYAEEKRWFLRETEDARRKLADEYRVEETRKTERRVIGELRGIVGDPKLSADDKRSAVFAIWEMCVGDGDEKWQRVVEAFIRERMPRDGELGYSPELLAQLNRKRASVRSFAPYQED